MKSTKFFALFLLLLFISSLFVSTFSFAFAAELVENTWSSKTPMQQARGGLGVITVNNKIYAIGGKTANGEIIGTNEQYDPQSDTWTTLKPMPTYRAYFAIAAFEGKIYCIGGFTKSGVCSVNEVYDVASGNWQDMACLPVKGGNLQGGVVGGKIFVLDGCDLFVYDPVDDVWLQKSGIFFNSLVGSNFVAATVVDDRIVVVGNFSFVSSRSELRVVIYDPVGDVWCEGAKPSFGAVSGVVGATSGCFASKMVYFMGTTTEVVQYPGFSVSYVDIRPIGWAYDPVGDVWVVASVSSNRVDFGVAVVDDVLYVIGGYSVVMKETVITTSREDYVGDGTWRTHVVSEQHDVSCPVIGDAVVLNLQYVPVGYDFVVVSVSPVVSLEPYGSSGSSFNGVVIGLLGLIVGVVIGGVVFYFKRRG
ncbi:MAG: hypothetical protein FWH37_06265 [Candidatus Bathyarchaeota archaeon]|nr:hypothetical protein [Candidatus Termiticorpusculum sp.]